MTCRCSAPRACSPGARRPPAPRWPKELTGAETSVGTRITLEHLAPSPVGREVAVTASVAHVDGRLVRFTVAATDAGKLVGSGEVTRVVVDRSRFLGRLG